MKRVEQYVDDIVSGLHISKDEQQELKEEFMTHLTDHIDELMIKGYSKEEAISQAMTSFGQQAKIHKEMKKVLFPFYKFIRFGWSVIIVASLLNLTSHFLTQMYFPHYNSSVTIDGFIFFLMVSTFFLGIAEVLYDAILQEYHFKWLTNPWIFFLVPAIFLEIIIYIDFAKNAHPNDLWIWHDDLFIPLYLVYYVVSRQIFTLLFVKREKKSRRKFVS
ncbi:permease prefix domain 1-containing protein [Solibacillus sp. CAU 1738]|uniref:permease prefix domain 1-containing protein n=1 Tax=Solibacillus sp. CAU 1738 TaxID=3140363 RepID=UPI00326051AB